MSAEERPSTPHRTSQPSQRIVVGRYELLEEIARGGLATVYVGRLRGDGGLKRTVAVKRLHAHFRTDGEIATMFLDEARLALRVRHPNVIHAVDVVLHESELFIVMEYIPGISLSQLLRVLGEKQRTVPLEIASSILSNVLHGLHAAHTTCDEQGVALHIVHRDVSPQNVIVGVDGHARVLDFGVAKAVNQAHVTRTNEVKGKLTYMAPESLLGEPVTSMVDIFAVGIVLWEILTGYRLFYGDNDGMIVRKILEEPIPPPSSLNPAVTHELDALVLRALERDPKKRFATADEMADRLETILRPASPREVGTWLREVAPDVLRSRAEQLARVEDASAWAFDETAPDSGPYPGIPVVDPKKGGRRIATFVGALAVGVAAILGGSWAMKKHAPTPATASVEPKESASIPLLVTPSGAALAIASAAVDAGVEAPRPSAAPPTPPSVPTPARVTRPPTPRSVATAPAPSPSGNQYPRW